MKRINFELTELEAKVKRLEGEKTSLYNDLYAQNAALEKAQNANKGYLSTIDDLNAQIAGMSMNPTPVGNRIDTSAQKTGNEGEGQSDYLDRLTAMENKMERLEEEARFQWIGNTVARENMRLRVG